MLLDSTDWDDASVKIQEYFDTKRINYYSDEAIKFVDIMQVYFTENSMMQDKKKSVENT